jgi:hypothetical protein
MGAKGCAGLAAFALLATLSACGIWGDGGSDSTPVEVQTDDSGLPARYGFYVEADGVLGRLDVAKSVQAQPRESLTNLPSDVTLIIFDRSLADRSLRLEDAIALRKLAHVRNDVAASGAATRAQKDAWVAVDLPAFDVPLDFQPIEGPPEMVRAIPARPLASGLYSLQLHVGESVVAGRFGVQWSTVDEAQYAADNCVDRYAGLPVYKLCSDLSARLPGQAIAQPALQQQQLQPRKTQPPLPPAPAQPAPRQQALQQQPSQPPPPTPAARGLKLRDVRVGRAVDQGIAILTVEGTVVNTGNEASRVPPLLATVSDTKGTQLERWTFAAENPELSPGGTTGFRTQMKDPTDQSTNVAVMFAPDRAPAAQ